MSGGCLRSIPELASTERGDHRGGKGERKGLTVSLISQRKTEPALRQQPSLKATPSARKKKKEFKNYRLFVSGVCIPVQWARSSAGGKHSAAVLIYNC